MRCRPFAIVLLLLCLVATVAFAASDQRGLSARPKAPTGEEVKGDLWLVTIGINSYISWPRLKTAVNDAKAVKETLLKRYHLDPARVVELTDEKATRKNILGAFRDLAKKVRPDDSLLVYYAGHGHIDSITGKGSWIPVESGTDDPSAWISNRDITDYLNINAIKARHILLVSDSCFSGDFFRGSRAGLPTIDDAFLKRAYSRSSRQAISSGGLEPVSDAGFAGNSVFSHFLVAALNNNRNPYLIPSEIFSEIKAGVGKNANQLPQFGDLHGTGGQDGGELILFLKGADDSKLKELGATSAARQKELEQLKKAEQEAAVAKQKEQQEIAHKQAELNALDKQIADMKTRLGTGTARSSDSLNSILAMVEQKETQAKRLEELRRQREAEELKRQQEIERLKQEAITQRHTKIADDVAKFQKIAQSPYGKDLKESAWDALIASYPEAKNVARYDLDGFWIALGLFVADNGTIGNIDDLKRQMAFAMISIPAGCVTINGIGTCVDAFRIGKFVVTQVQWKQLMGSNPSHFNLFCDSCPVENVSWNDVQSFIQKWNDLTGSRFRLPTEVEWFYACQAGTQHTYCGSDNIDAVAWYAGNSNSRTQSVGQKEPNAWGLYDMSGNVWQWVQDLDVSYPSGPKNPVGPLSGTRRVSRGGSWDYYPVNVEVASRRILDPTHRNNNLGFRLAAPVE